MWLYGNWSSMETDPLDRLWKLIFHPCVRDRLRYNEIGILELDLPAKCKPFPSDLGRGDEEGIYPALIMIWIFGCLLRRVYSAFDLWRLTDQNLEIQSLNHESPARHRHPNLQIISLIYCTICTKDLLNFLANMNHFVVYNLITPVRLNADLVCKFLIS